MKKRRHVLIKENDSPIILPYEHAVYIRFSESINSYDHLAKKYYSLIFNRIRNEIKESIFQEEDV